MSPDRDASGYPAHGTNACASGSIKQRPRFAPALIPPINTSIPPMQTREIKITNHLGLHARAAAKIVRLAGRFHCRVWVIFEGRRANARSMLAVMMLAATMGSTIRLETSGPDEAVAMNAMFRLISDRFGEPG
jgi:phosphocarrier protein HPr